MSANKPEYEDPFGVFPSDDIKVVAEPIPTGLSIEDDAKRILVIEFGTCFCPNCETYYELEPGHFCPYCTWQLTTVGTKPLRCKR